MVEGDDDTPIRRPSGRAGTRHPLSRATLLGGAGVESQAASLGRTFRPNIVIDRPPIIKWGKKRT